MSKIVKQIRQNCQLLAQSEKRMEDIYRIVFAFGDNDMVECATMTRKVVFTYRQIQQQIEKVAGAIAAVVGVTDRFIGLHGENCYQWMVLFWAILKSGNKPYLINLRQPQGFTKGILRTLNAACVVSCGEVDGFEVPSFSFESLLQKGGNTDVLRDVPFGNEFALSTNGTTLKEKICIYSGLEISEQIINILSMIKQNPKLVATKHGKIKMLVFLPLYHIFGLEAVFLWYSFFGATFVFMSEMSPKSILRTIRNHDVTHVYAVPLLWHSIEKFFRRELAVKGEKTVKKFKRAADLSLKVQNISPAIGSKLASVLFKDVRRRLLGDNIQFCISGGSFIKQSTLELFNSLGYLLSNGYGMSEVGITSVDLSRKPKDRMLGSIGKPFDSVSYRIGEQNQLLIHGRSLCRKLMVEGVEEENVEWFDSGDVVRCDQDGRFYIDGRISDLVFGDDGENLNPDFSEQAFVLQDALELSVIGNEDNSKLMLIVRIAPNLMTEQKERLLNEAASCNESLPMSYRVRTMKYTFDPLMEKQSIKVSRSYLKKAIEEERVTLFDMKDLLTATNSGQESEIKNIIRELFAKTLGVSADQINDAGHYMNDLGGSSLDYFGLISEIENRFSIRLEFESEQFGYSVNEFERVIKVLMK